MNLKNIICKIFGHDWNIYGTEVHSGKMSKSFIVKRICRTCSKRETLVPDSKNSGYLKFLSIGKDLKSSKQKY